MSGLEALLAGKTLVKRYEIQEVIGRGGFAAVYRADDLRLGRPVAVKVITVPAPDPETRERLHARFEREARSAASLPHHPNVVTVHDFGTDPETGIDFLVMELLRGETLAQHLAREGRPPLARSLQVLREAAEGLAVGHRSGLVHRDVKPGNLFLAEAHDDEPFRVVVLDFGIARIADDEGSDITRTAMGENPLSPAYASPEQLRGDRALTPASDVFGLGVVAYQLLTGEKPFPADPGQRARGRGAVRPLREMNPEVPPALAAVVERAMAERPEDRFPEAGAFADALEAAAGPDDRTMVFTAGAPDDDATLLAPAAAVAGAAGAARAADRTVVAPARPAAPPPPPPPASRPPVSVPARKRSPMGAILLVLLLLAGGAAAAVWAFGGGGGSGDADEGVATVPGDSVTETTDGSTDERIDGTIVPSPAETPPSDDGGAGGDDDGIVGDDDGSPVVPGATTPTAPAGETPAPTAPAPSQPTIPVPPPASGGQPTVPVTPTPPPAQPRPTPPITRPSPPPAPRPVPPPAPAPAPSPPPAPAPPPVLGRPVEPRPATPAPNPNAPRDTITLPSRQPSTPGPASPGASASGTTP